MSKYKIERRVLGYVNERAEYLVRAEDGKVLASAEYFPPYEYGSPKIGDMKWDHSIRIMYRPATSFERGRSYSGEALEAFTELVVYMRALIRREERKLEREYARQEKEQREVNAILNYPPDRWVVRLEWKA